MNESQLYERVKQELREGVVDQDLWAKALNDQNGDEELAEKEYIEYRVAELRQEEIGTEEPTEATGEVEFSPSREPVKKRNIVMGIAILVILFVLVILLGFLLHDYFSVRE